MCSTGVLKVTPGGDSYHCERMGRPALSVALALGRHATYEDIPDPINDATAEAMRQEPPLKLHLRLFANCGNDDDALAITGRIESALSTYRPSTARRPRRYYEATELFEFSYLLDPATADAFDAVVSLAQSGWFRQDNGRDRSAVWNREGERTFLVPEVSWAALQLLHAA